MKAPALILGFDDCFIDEWHSIIDLLHLPILWRLEHIGKVTKENGIGVYGL